jgi:hypothetical protein
MVIAPCSRMGPVTDDERNGLLNHSPLNGIYGHSRFCNTDFDDKLACLNLSGV